MKYTAIVQPALPTDDMKSFHGQLRRGLQSFSDDIDELIPYFEKVIYKLVHLQVIYTGLSLPQHRRGVERKCGGT